MPEEEKPEFAFKVGETAVHPFRGVGEIIAIEEKKLEGKSNTYYVLSQGSQTVWVPVNKADKIGLRPVVSRQKLAGLIEILKSEAIPLEKDLRTRQAQIASRLTDRSLESLGGLVRDLTYRAVTAKLNESDANTLRRIKALLIGEWAVVRHITREEAEQQLDEILRAALTTDEDE